MRLAKRHGCFLREKSRWYHCKHTGRTSTTAFFLLSSKKFYQKVNIQLSSLIFFLLFLKLPVTLRFPQYCVLQNHWLLLYYISVGLTNPFATIFLKNFSVLYPKFFLHQKNTIFLTKVKVIR